jgi:hypothetical protein
MSANEEEDGSISPTGRWTRGSRGKPGRVVEEEVVAIAELHGIGTCLNEGGVEGVVAHGQPDARLVLEGEKIGGGGVLESLDEARVSPEEKVRALSRRIPDQQSTALGPLVSVHVREDGSMASPTVETQGVGGRGQGETNVYSHSVLSLDSRVEEVVDSGLSTGKKEGG